MAKRNGVETTGSCDPQFDSNCDTQPNGRGGANENSQQNTRHPNGSNAPNGASPYPQNPNERPDSQPDPMSVPPNRLIQTSVQNSDSYAAQQMGDRMVNTQSLYGLGDDSSFGQNSRGANGNGGASGSGNGGLSAGDQDPFSGQMDSGGGMGGGSFASRLGRSGGMGADMGLGMDGASAALASAGLSSRDDDMSQRNTMTPMMAVPRTSREYEAPERSANAQPVEIVRRRSPYDNIPSLYDMYLQAVPRPTTPRRFGSEVFANGSRDPQMIPMDLPVGPDYVVGPGDGLSIDLWGGVSQRLFRTVDREGRVSLPEAGPVLVSGKTLAEVQENLQQSLRTQFRDVSAEVSLARLRTIRVYEVGDVANPGAYDISSLSTPLNALFAAGGPTQKGSLRIVKHYPRRSTRAGSGPLRPASARRENQFNATR